MIDFWTYNKILKVQQMHTHECMSAGAYTYTHIYSGAKGRTHQTSQAVKLYLCERQKSEYLKQKE
jgi:hypothetical protein